MITGTKWFSGKDNVGIVQVVEDHQKETYRQTGDANFKYYIGVGLGGATRDDAQNIVNWGSPFDFVAGNALFGVQVALKSNWR
jgi:hypothetical protein